MDKIVGEDFEVTESMRSEINAKLTKIRQYTNNDESDFNVFLSRDSDHTFTVRINIHIERVDMEGSFRDPDFYVALNKAKQNLVRQIVDKKEKRVHNRH